MSLDITIISPEPILKKSTGIYGRVDGQIRELTPKECVQKFPDAFAHIDDVPVDTHLSDEFWHGNITHNLNEMASDCVSWDGFSLYQLLWGKSLPNFKKWTYVSHLSECLDVLKNDPEHFKKFNPENGWGTYEQLVEFVEEFIKALITMPEGSQIKYSR